VTYELLETALSEVRSWGSSRKDIPLCAHSSICGVLKAKPSSSSFTCRFARKSRVLVSSSSSRSLDLLLLLLLAWVVGRVKSCRLVGSRSEPLGCSGAAQLATLLFFSVFVDVLVNVLVRVPFNPPHVNPERSLLGRYPLAIEDEAKELLSISVTLGTTAQLKFFFKSFPSRGAQATFPGAFRSSSKYWSPFMRISSTLPLVTELYSRMRSRRSFDPLGEFVLLCLWTSSSSSSVNHGSQFSLSIDVNPLLLLACLLEGLFWEREWRRDPVGLSPLSCCLMMFAPIRMLLSEGPSFRRRRPGDRDFDVVLGKSS